MLQQRDLRYAVKLRHPDPLAELSNRLGRVTPTPQTSDRRHPGIVPATHHPVGHHLQQATLAHHRVSQIQSSKLGLLGDVDPQLLDIPLV